RHCAPPGTAPASRHSSCTKSFLDFAAIIPHRPGRSTSAEEVFKVLLFLESIHAGAIAVLRIGHQPACIDQPPERFFHQFLAVVNVTEYLLTHYQVPAVHPRARFRDVLDASYKATRLRGDKMKAGSRFHTHKAGDISAILERFNDCREGYIRKAIGVVGYEHFLSLKLPLHGFETLANVGSKPSVH